MTLWSCSFVIDFPFYARKERETIKPALCPPHWRTAAVNLSLHEQQQHWCQQKSEVLQVDVLTFKKTKRLILFLLLCCVSFCQTLICLTAKFKKAFIFKPMQLASVSQILGKSNSISFISHSGFYFHLYPLKQYGASYSFSLEFPANTETQIQLQPGATWQSCCSSRRNCVLLRLKGSLVPCVSIRTLSVSILMFPFFQFSGVIIHVMVTDCSQELDWIRRHRTSSFNWIETALYPGVSQWLMGGNLK